MKSNASINTKIKLIAEVVSYGLGQLEWDIPAPSSYNHGSIDTLGHLAACCITQWITNDSTGTGETIEALHLEENPSRKQLEKYLDLYLKAIS